LIHFAPLLAHFIWTRILLKTMKVSKNPTKTLNESNRSSEAAAAEQLNVMAFLKTQRARFKTSLAALGTVVILTGSAYAQTWQTVDDFQYAAGQVAVNFGLTLAPSGVVFACGFAADGVSGEHGLVMASADGGNTWSTPIDDIVFPGGAARDDGGIVCDSAGNLYAAGRYYSSSPSYRFVRRSTDGGATWSTVDTVTINGSYASPLAAGGITADAAGNVYVTEPVAGTWTIRKGTGGTNFSTVDAFQPSGSQAEAVFASTGVFAVGYGTVVSKKSNSQAWIVRRSLNDGATWATVDTYQPSSGYNAVAYAAGADAHGNIYAVGRAFIPNRSSSIGHWQVRKSANGGASWTTVDDYALFTSGNQVALGFATDSNGNLFATGWASAGTGTGPYCWIVRESVGGTGPWTTVDNFSYASGAMAHSIAADNSGNVFVGGQGTPAAGPVHWMVRKN
jgi:hypothetical protein